MTGLTFGMFQKWHISHGKENTWDLWELKTANRDLAGKLLWTDFMDNTQGSPRPGFNSAFHGHSVTSLSSFNKILEHVEKMQWSQPDTNNRAGREV